MDNRTRRGLVRAVVVATALLGCGLAANAATGHSMSISNWGNGVQPSISNWGNGVHIEAISNWGNGVQPATPTPDASHWH